MHRRRTARASAGFAAVLAVCAAGVGCNTFPHAAALAADGQTGPTAAPAQARGAAPGGDNAPGGAFRQVAATVGELQPRSEVYWSIEVSPGNAMGRTALVGPDGTLELGPYGAVPVAGLTVEQARARIEQHLARYLRGPKVTLRVADVTTAAEWTSPAPTAAPQVPAAPSAPGARSIWRPAQREAAEPLTVSARENQFATAARPASAGGWQPAGQSWIRPVAGTGGPEISPAPRPVTPPSPETTLVVPPPDGGPLLGPHAGPPAGPAVGLAPPQPFGRGHAPWEGNKLALPPYRIAPPDILQIESLEGTLVQRVLGPHLVRPDGTVGLGVYGAAFVAGMTIEEARVAIAKVLHARLDPSIKSLKDVLDGLSVDVLAYNSRVYYVITDRLGFGTIVDRIPITGSETVLDAISQLRGLPPESSRRHIWVARKTPGHGGGENKLPVDWNGITKRGEMQTNYQILPGDRIYVMAEPIQRVDFVLSKWLSPVQRVLGAMLLGSETVNSIRAGGTSTGGGVVR
jgi:polysaccharide export outer membrane protein